MTQPKTALAYLRNEKAKAEQKLRSCQHREKLKKRKQWHSWFQSLRLMQKPMKRQSVQKS